MAITYDILFLGLVLIFGAAMIPPVLLSIKIHNQISVMDNKLDEIIAYFALSSEALKDKRLTSFDGLKKIK